MKPTIEPSPNLGEVGMIIHVMHNHILFVNTLNSSKLEGSDRYIGRTDPHHVLIIQLLEIMRMQEAYCCEANS